jgi:AcrR family transcriptional regulator
MGTRRQVIVQAALELVAEAGLPALTIAALTVRSGASNGSVYHHFGSRNGVVAALYDDSFRQCVDALLVTLDDRPAALAVPDMVRRYLDWVVANPARADVLYAAVSEDVGDGKADAFAPVASWFAERMVAREIRALPPSALDPVVMGPAHECARRFLRTSGAFDLADVREIAAQAVWRIVGIG